MNKGNIVRVMVTFESRLIRTPDGNIYSRIANYNFLSRYLKVFDEVIVLARLRDGTESEAEELAKVNGPNVRVIAVPYYLGPWQYLKRYWVVNSAINKAASQADAYILRSGQVGSLLGRNLRRKGIPYGVEVVSDPWQVFAPGSNKSLFRPLLRVIGKLSQARLCRYAVAASYVTRESLQRRYPSGGWTTHYSSVVLPSEVIVDDSVVTRRMKRIEEKIHAGVPLRLCFVGDMSQPYKAVDVLLKAVCECIKKGLNLELILIGGGRLIPDYKKQAMDLGIADRVKFLGQLPPGGEVFKQLDQADLFILPSKTEGLPRVVVEAMARGLPCIASNVGGIPELLAVEDLVPPGDLKALEKKIQDALSNVERLEQMARRNLKNAREYHIDKLSKRRRELFEKLVEISRSRHCEMDV